MSTRKISFTAMMAALVFTGTFFLKIPFPFGYTHLGDGLIILSVDLLGPAGGILAASIGAGLADLAGGYAIWVVPTAIIKGLWAACIGLSEYKLLKGKKSGYLPGAVAGGILQCILYFLVKIPLYGLPEAVAEEPVLIGQTAAGLVIGAILVSVFRRSRMTSKLHAMLAG